MTYSKAIIDLIKEARRRVPSEDKPSIKLANPDVLSELNTIFKKSKDPVLKALIKEIFHLAGEGWEEKLNSTKQSNDANDSGKYLAKMYRGIAQAMQEPEQKKSDPNKVHQRIYRGQVVTTS